MITIKQLKSNLRYHNIRRIRKGQRKRTLSQYIKYVVKTSKDRDGRLCPHINERKRNPEYAKYLKYRIDTKRSWLSFKQWKDIQEIAPRDCTGRINYMVKTYV